MKKLFTFFTLISFFTSCFNVRKDYTLLEIKEPISINGNFEEIEIGIPSQIEWINSNLYLFRVNGCAAKIFDENNKINIADFGKMGPGPDEFISPFYAGYNKNNNRIYINDISLKTFREYEIIKKEDTLLFKKHITKNIKCDGIVFRAAVRLKNGYTVAQVISGTNKMFILFDSDMKIHHTFESNPVGEDATVLHPFSGYLTSNENQFTFAAMYYGYIVSYNISDNGDVTKLWEHYLSCPYYETNRGRVKWDRERNKMGFFDVKMNDKHIYALYSGKKDIDDISRVPSNLLIFDLNGKLENNYLLDKQSGRLTIAHDSIVYTIYTEPDVGIAKYKLWN
ncbi:BF3164 family lipoprotein [Parabacteroides provencensis]|uniref:BF3164 family lipoprotein n=1 Tax=Parabacteroides provencensis TaxID=1944636 RepID=UPI001304438D|nr:BF3164 family lipoprotein [Parabacteroides provencensis]